MTIKGSTFKNNTAYQAYGENIYSVHATELLSIKNCTLESFHNSVYTSGLKLSVNQLKMTGLSQSPIDNNVFPVDGGAFYIS